MGRISGAVIEEFIRVADELEHIAKAYGFDLSKDEDVNRLNLITDGERIHHKRVKKGEIPAEWFSASFPEKVVGSAYDFLHQLDIVVKEAPDDTNDCDCCNSEAMGLKHLCTLNYMAGFLRAHPVREYSDIEQSEFFSTLGKSGAEKRHAPMRELQDWAVEKYKSGEWKSANGAAHKLKDSVIAHGRTINAHLSEENAQRTIAEWFRKSV